MSKKISDLPAYSGPLIVIGSIPITISGQTYKANPSDFAPSSAVPTKTSDILNNGSDGIHPFITAQALTSLHSLRISGNGQTYTLPSGAIAFKGWINDGIQHKEDPLFTSDLTTFTQSGNIVTFKKAITFGARVIIDYIL